MPDRPVFEYDRFAEMAARSTSAVLCLLFALRFHDLTPQRSSDVWLAIAQKAGSPHFDYPPLRVIRRLGLAMTEGVDIADLASVQVRMFSVAKTVADCFKFRNRIGLDVVFEALREAWNSKPGTMDALWRYAEICQVANVMCP